MLPFVVPSHTASALKAGWKEEDTLAVRAGTHPDKKWQVINVPIDYPLAKEI